MNGVDPYRPPEADPAKDEGLKRSELREIVVAWEKLRLVYNAILLIPGLVVVGLALNAGMPGEFGVGGAVMVALAANAAFFLGPLAEVYVRAVLLDGRPLGRGRWLIFSAGMVVSAGVFVAGFLMFAA